jgi:uncharacterized membrane protein
MIIHLSFKHPLLKLLCAFSILCIIMVVLRMAYSESFRYLWLIWNLFLAWIPLFFVLVFRKNERIRKSTLRSSALLLSWLLFFPNAPYVLTDLVHLLQSTDIPFWYDLILILSFAWTSLLTGFISLIEIQNFFTEKTNKFIGWCFAYMALIFGSFGVYLGRYGRYNSWDVITHPLDLSRDILGMFLNPLDNTRMIGMTFFFSCFLILCYMTLLALIDSKVHSLKKPSDELYH